MQQGQYGTTRAEQLAELKRELKSRQLVYPKWWKAKKITKQDALHRLNCLQAVIEDFEQRHKPNDKQGSFGI